MTVQGVARLSAGTHTITLSVASVGIAPGSPATARGGTLSAITAPFGPDGTISP